MKLCNILKIAVRTISNMKLRALLICFVSICSFFLIDQMVTNAFRFVYHKIELEELLSYKENQTFQLNFTYVEETEEFTKNVTELVRYIGTLEHVKGAGSYDFKGVYFDQLRNNKEYIEKNKLLFTNTFRLETPGITEVLYINSEISDLCKIHALEGKDNLKGFEQEDIIPVLVGYDYKDIIPVGTKLTMEGNDKTYLVIGILSKGTKWYGDVDAIGTNIEVLDSKLVVAREQEEMAEENDIMTVLSTLSTTYFVIDSQKNTGFIQKKIKEKADELMLSVKTVPLTEVLKEYEESYQDDWYVSIVIAIMFIAFSALSISSASVVSMLMRKSEYGIMYANGFSRKDIMKEILLENTYLIFLSGFVAFCLRTYMLLKNKYKVFAELMIRVHWRLTLPVIVILVIVVIFISSMIPMLIIKNMRPVELIGGNE